MSYLAKQVVAGLSRPLFACAPPGDHGRLFIVEQGGRIRILDLTVQPAVFKPAPFLTITGLSNGNEQGLLGLAFHPDFASNRTFYVNYTDLTGTTVIARYFAQAGSPDVADSASAQIVLKVSQPFPNHNGGWLAFGPDGFLYIALGDGGAGNDPGNRAQNLSELLGKLLRIDVNGDDFPGDPDRNYAIPATNPFINVANARPEVWAHGLRNPWRCAFDRATGQLFIADVGQSEREEVNLQPAGQGGQNYGWRIREGRHDSGLGSATGVALTDPIHEYDHGQGIAIIGGYVYRGANVPELAGKYFFADYTGPIWSFQLSAGVTSSMEDETVKLFPKGGPTSITSFGEDAAGELYLLSRSPGIIYRIEQELLPSGAAALSDAATGTRPVGALRSLRWEPPKGKRADDLHAGAAAVADAMALDLVPTATGTPVEQARHLLRAAAEIEHSLLVQYLYAAYSLDPKWPEHGGVLFSLVEIAVEEMGHLATVQNLLLAVGGEPYYARESPQPALDPFAFRLQPLSVSSLAKYVNAESPLREQLQKFPDLLRRAERAYAIADLALAPAGGGSGPSVNHVGVLYATLYWLFKSGEGPEGPWELAKTGFENKHLVDGDFSGTANLQQISPDEIISSHSDPVYTPGSAYVKQIASRADALEAIYFIASEGEGWVENDAENSHFERFLQAFETFVRLQDTGIEPTLPVPTDPKIGAASERQRISHPSAVLWAELSDVRYQILVGELWLATLMTPTGAPTDPRKRLFRRSVVTEMKIGVGRIAPKLASLPRIAPPQPVPPGVPLTLSSAGAPFRLPDVALPEDVAGWKQFLKDRIDATAALRVRLESSENTVGLSSQDVSGILNPLRTSDEQLLALLGP